MIKRYFLWFKNGTIAWLSLSHGSRPRRVIKAILSSLISVVLKNTFLKNNVILILNHFPRLKHRLKQIKNRDYTEQVSFELTHLSATQRDIFAMIKNSSNRSKKI